jgi:hypothetical protein
MAVVAQVEQGPIIAVTAEDDMPTAASVAAVGTTIGIIFYTAHVCASASAFARAAVYFYIVDEIGFSHDEFQLGVRG